MQLVTRLFEYLEWADNVVFNIIANISDEAAKAQIGSYPRSIHDICQHLAADYWEWYIDVSAENQTEPTFSSMNIHEVLEFIQKMKQQWRRYFAEQNPESVVKIGQGHTVSVSEFVFHLTNHAAYHRGQIALALRTLGKEVPMTDYVPFVISR